MMNRGKSVPGGACGFWGACGAGISSGMFISIISKSTPLANEPFALSHKMTADSLGQIGEVGGPRCCKRDSFLSILAAIDFVKAHFGIEMEKPEVVCRFSAQNNWKNRKLFAAFLHRTISASVNAVHSRKQIIDTNSS